MKKLTLQLLNWGLVQAIVEEVSLAGRQHLL